MAAWPATRGRVIISIPQLIGVFVVGTRSNLERRASPSLRLATRAGELSSSSLLFVPDYSLSLMETGSNTARQILVLFYTTNINQNPSRSARARTR